MSELKAVIVAAGRGIRMGPRGELTPKGLIRVGGVPLVRRSVSLLQKRGIGTIRIVTGHLSDQYESEFGTSEGVELVHNPEYETTGSLRSLAVGLSGQQGPVVVLESDLIFEAATLAPILQAGSRILVSGATESGDEVYIWSRPGREGQPIFHTMSKDKSHRAEPRLGELVGVSVFDAGKTEALKRAALQTLLTDPRADYESAVIHMAETRDVPCFKFEDLAWTEMDDEAMYSRAVNVIWPKIQKRDAGP